MGAIMAPVGEGSGCLAQCASPAASCHAVARAATSCARNGPSQIRAICNDKHGHPPCFCLWTCSVGKPVFPFHKASMAKPHALRRGVVVFGSLCGSRSGGVISCAFRPAHHRPGRPECPQARYNHTRAPWPLVPDHSRNCQRGGTARYGTEQASPPLGRRAFPAPPARRRNRWVDSDS